MQRLFLLLLILSFSTVKADPSSASVVEEDIQQIEQLYSNWREAVETADIQRYVTALHPNIRLFPPGAEVIDTAANYAKFLVPVFAAADYQIEVKRAPVADVIGDFAVVEYEYIIHLKLKNPEEGVSEPGAMTASRSEARYFDVLRKTDGKWKVWRHTWQ
ncbi:MAG: hypothetical protein CMQ20_01105 [Gammaproteobacteria bacterium]|jgi:ketosteroid isomerase-like protein|nr:hypothetical protein [Gammaproteobacteria bacterium]|tara:strand:+ start:118 stop:597 length:480 start_codon:yes stop_codon:yes gene_type:complete